MTENTVLQMRADLARAEEQLRQDERDADLARAEKRLRQGEDKTFHQRHGDKSKFIMIGNLSGSHLGQVQEFACANGARVLCFEYAPTEYREPPEDAGEMARLRLRYYRALLERAEKDFGLCREHCYGRRHWSWPADGVYGTCPQGSDVEMLKGLKTIVIAAREAVARLEAEVAVLPEEVAARRREAEKREEQEHQWRYKQLIADQINSVTI